MKTLTLLTLYFLYTQIAYSQVEFAPIGAQWIQNASANDQGAPTFDPIKDYFVIESTGDTIVDNVTYRKVGEYLFYQDGDQIYYLGEGALRLVYDFDVAVGDTVTYELGDCGSNGNFIMPFDFLVQEVSQISIDQQLLKKVICRPLPSNLESVNYEYIEKMGSIIKIVEPQPYCAYLPSFHPDWLRCYIDNDISYSTEEFLSYNEPDCFYKSTSNHTIEWNDAYFSIHPNPARDYLFLSSGEETSSTFQVQLYNARGLSVFQGEVNGDFNNKISMAQFSPGFYFIVIEDESGQKYGKKIWKE